MARYYSVILGINVFIGLFYFYMRRNWGISPKVLFLISAASVFTGMIFPVILGHSNLMMAVVANIVLIGIGAYYITGLISDKGQDSVVLKNKQKYLHTQLPEEEFAPAETAAVSEEAVEEELLPEAAVSEEAVEEELLPEAAVAAESVVEAIEKEIVAEEVMEEETHNDEQGVDHMSVLSSLRIEEDPFELRDSYISRGFDAKTEGKLELAVKYFSSALELNAPVDLEFMLNFDICTMLEELGQYKRAQEIIKQFRNDRPNLSEGMLQEVIILQKTLEILQDTLTKANTPNMPLSKVPALIRVSVEEKVNRWKNEVF